MRLKKILTGGCERLPDRAFDLAPPGAPPPNLVVVTGGVASGKTSLLDLVVAAKEDVGPYGPPRFLDPWRRPGEVAAKIVTEWWLDEAEVAEVGGAPWRIHETIIDPEATPEASLDVDDGLQKILARLDPAHPKVEYFHAGRRLPPPTVFLGSGSVAGERHLRLDASDHKYGTVHAFLVELSLGLHEPDGLPNKPGSRAILFDDMVRDLTGTIAFAGATRGSSPVPLFLRRDGSQRTLAQISHFEQQAVLLAATCVRSRLERGIALLDGPELGCSAERAAEVVRVLCRHVPTCQWIVATGRDVVGRLGHAHTIDLGGS